MALAVPRGDQTAAVGNSVRTIITNTTAATGGVPALAADVGVGVTADAAAAVSLTAAPARAGGPAVVAAVAALTASREHVPRVGRTLAVPRPIGAGVVDVQTAVVMPAVVFAVCFYAETVFVSVLSGTARLVSVPAGLSGVVPNHAPYVANARDVVLGQIVDLEIQVHH